MQTEYSITEAKNQLDIIIGNLEEYPDGVTVTKQGKPVAMIVSVKAYNRLTNKEVKRDFWEALQAFREKYADDLLPDDMDVWADVRDRSAGGEGESVALRGEKCRHSPIPEGGRNFCGHRVGAGQVG